VVENLTKIVPHITFGSVICGLKKGEDWMSQITLELLRPFFGTYLGFSPAGESNVGFGEIEIVVGEKEIKFRFATGLEIREKVFDVEGFTTLSEDEMRENCESNGVDADLVSERVSRFVVFRCGELGPLQLIFDKNVGNDICALSVRMGMADLLGPTILFNSTQAQMDLFEEALLRIEDKRGKGVVPRLRNNGKPENQK